MRKMVDEADAKGDAALKQVAELETSLTSKYKEAVKENKELLQVGGAARDGGGA